MTSISDERLEPCPFCGATPHRGPTKYEADQLRGEPFQNYAIWCPHSCSRINRANKEQAIAAWNRRTSHEGVREWRPIETAPKDGTWLELWRGPIDGAGIWSPLVVGRWWEFDDGGSWAWPDDVYDPWHDRTTADAYLERGDCYDSEGFTHWRPLAAPPALSPNKEDEDAA